jgi:hypothetical protein
MADTLLQVATMKSWNIKHKGHEICVENGWFSGERLIVDGEIQDEHTGFAFRSRLWGKVRNGDGAGEAIKVSLGGWFGISCRIFVDDRLIPSGG